MTMVKRFACVVGARPNFVKMAPILRALTDFEGIETVLIHTGQHYDKNLSDVFFDELQIRKPDVFLGVGSGSHAKQTSDVMVAIEGILGGYGKAGKPIDRIVVVGDVNSTMAAAIAAAKCNVPVAHVEAGLRSLDRTMPEEINRIITDSISDLLFVSEPVGVLNLRREGHDESEIHLVGNVMIDTLFSQLERAKQRDTLYRFGLEPKRYGVITLHRPSNVDDPKVLKNLMEVFIRLSSEIPFIFPIHPRTLARLKEFGLHSYILDAKANIQFVDPLGYLDFLCLTAQPMVIVTDSGGLQEESTALRIPCLTLRDNTERPITCDLGTSTLIGNSATLLQQQLESVKNGNYKVGKIPKLWDGLASERIANILCR